MSNSHSSLDFQPERPRFGWRCDGFASGRAGFAKRVDFDGCRFFSGIRRFDDALASSAARMRRRVQATISRFSSRVE